MKAWRGWLGFAGAGLFAWGMWACSSGSSTGSPATVPADASTTSDGAPVEQPGPDAGGGGSDAGNDATPFPDGGAVRVQDNQSQYELTEGASVTIAGNGYKFGAASTAGGQLRALSIILRHAALNDAGASEMRLPIPGTYRCNAFGAPGPNTPALSAVIQYNTPGPVIYQSETTSNCQVQLNEFGAVGSTSTGTFTGQLPQAGKPDAGMPVTGSFSLRRAQ